MIIESLNKLGLVIPTDVVVVSFDDPDAHRICYFPITAVIQELYKVVRTGKCNK